MKQFIKYTIPELNLENPVGDYKFKIEVSPFEQIESFFVGFEELISIKIRPITEYYNDNNKIFENAYVYNDFYKKLNIYLKQNFIHVQSGGVSRGFLDVFGVQDHTFAFINFDTGPEIVFDMSLLSSTSFFSQSIINLVEFILISLRTEGDFYEKKAISYEMRTIKIKNREKYERTVVQIGEFPIRDLKTTIRDVEELIMNKLSNTQYMKYCRKW